MELSADGSHGGQPLGEILVERGLISSTQLDQALAAQRDDGRPLGEVIVRLGFASGHTIAQALATQHGRIVKSEYGFATGFDARLSTTEPPETVESLGEPIGEGLRIVPAADDNVSTTLPTHGSDEHARVLRLTTQLLTATGDLTRAEIARAEALAAAAENAAALQTLEELAAAQAREIEELRAMRASSLEMESDVAQAAQSDARSNHFLFFQTAGAGYIVVERDGPPPHVGETVDVSADGGSSRAVVTKLGLSPLPGAAGVCAYLI